MSSKPNFKLTLIACCLGSVLQASIVNVMPLLFIPLKELYGFSYGELGLLVTANFVTQFICDFALGAAADKFGMKKFLIATPIVVILGFSAFMLSPFVFSSKPYIGFFIGTVIFSAGGGLLELLLSPIVNSIPADNKSTLMSMLHSFYAWGQVGVVLITTLFLSIFKKTHWQIVYLPWILLAFALIFLFSISPIIQPEKGEGKSNMSKIIFKPMFLLALLLMLGGGAAELSMSQWVSSFMEKGMNIPKATGDILGMSMFGVMMGLGRMFYGKFGKNLRVTNVLTAGTVLSVICYLVVAFSKTPAVSLAFCALCGLAVSLLWPCTLTLTAEYFPSGGTLMFAILAGGGDAGCSTGPWLVGAVTDAVEKTGFASALGAALNISAEQLALRCGILSGAIFPFLTFFGLLLFKKGLNKKKKTAAFGE